MSEGIIIALITAIGSLLGGIIGQIITANATVKAAAIKEKINPTASNGEKPRSWSIVIGGALIGATATLIVLFLLGIFPPPVENPPTATAVYETPTSKPVTKESSNPAILFNEDFEDGKAQKVTYVSNGWQIISDETGNKVYDIDNSKGYGFPGIDFGTQEQWKDYEIKLRARIISGSWIIIYFRASETNNGNYVVSLDSSNVSLNYTTRGSDWKVMINREYSLKKNIWYWIRIEAKGAEIKVSVDNDTVIYTDDTRYSTGYINIQAGQNTHAQFDDIQVTSLK
jgi:hypothetical protein